SQNAHDFDIAKQDPRQWTTLAPAGFRRRGFPKKSAYHGPASLRRSMKRLDSPVPINHPEEIEPALIREPAARHQDGQSPGTPLSHPGKSSLSPSASRPRVNRTLNFPGPRCSVSEWAWGPAVNWVKGPWRRSANMTQYRPEAGNCEA